MQFDTSWMEFLSWPEDGTPETLIYEEPQLAQDVSSPQSEYADIPLPMHGYFTGPDGGPSTFLHFPYPHLGYRVSPNDWDPAGPMSPESVSTMDSMDSSILGSPSFHSQSLHPEQWF